MELSVCTISFRHHLQSIEEIAAWASQTGFTGIELWGIHARYLEAYDYDEHWLKSYHLHTAMLSDYIPFEEEERLKSVQTLSRLAHRWGANKIRTFAGGKGSQYTHGAERREIVSALRRNCEQLSEHGLSLLIEIHPNTLADTLSSTLQLIEEIDHPALYINYDVLHMWESGVDPVQAYKQLQPAIAHLHLKNISSRQYLHVFEPANVYAASGSRKGMVGLFEGAVDYQDFFSRIKTPISASLEWFGGDVKRVLQQDVLALQEILYKKLV
ncbi:sugar phosphate isomerase/epimerase [Ectobacillus antri]|uniref:Sugar phosphate isomerase/epimerase n=1 Tax=Ectobacillus antri TaxID=2486280 RepID=A0ABT6H5K0_9BACI|nr:sugar phosphate isomerase/epimerase [Ectobacillus antri]MDG4657356.1 sugar phosphate isomerase/epimerase [Ectobacillus antri]MDG5754513.1 sugar phosphate isomerase/epimerase [Ectobacillus antri]